MRILTIVPILLSILITQCSSSKHTTDKQKMQIARANFKRWSKPPLQSSDVPEKGTDLIIVITNWPPRAVPVHIIYQGRLSFKPKIVSQDSSAVTIKARIVRTSSVLQQTSQQADQSDGLIYKDKNGHQNHIEITSWEHQQ